MLEWGVSSGSPKAQYEVLGKSGGIGRFNEHGVLSRCDPITERSCDPAGAQTQNLQNRNLTLYSIELRGRFLDDFYPSR